MSTQLSATMHRHSGSAVLSAFRLRALSVLFLAIGVGFSIAACDRSPVEPRIVADDLTPAFNGIDEEHSHFRYGTLSWRPLGLGDVEFRLISAFRRSGYAGSGADGLAVAGDIITETIGATRLFFGDGNQTPVLQFLVTAHSVSGNWVIGEALNPGSTDPGILHTYTDPGPFEAELNTCCRIFASFLANRGNGGYRLLTTVDPFDTNRSPVSTQAPIVVVDEAPDAQFVVPAGDPDGDPIIWRLSSDAEAGGGPSPPGLTIDASTGVATWNNVGLDQTRFWTVQVVVEDRTTQTPVDFLLRIQPEVPPVPTCTIDPSGPIDAAVGQRVTLTVTGGPEGLAIEVNSAGLPPGASMDPSLPHSGVGPVTSAFTWTPTAAQEGSHPIVFSVSDLTGQQALCSTTIHVEDVDRAASLLAAIDRLESALTGNLTGATGAGANAHFLAVVSQEGCRFWCELGRAFLRVTNKVLSFFSSLVSLFTRFIFTSEGSALAFTDASSWSDLKAALQDAKSLLDVASASVVLAGLAKDFDSFQGWSRDLGDFQNTARDIYRDDGALAASNYINDKLQNDTPWPIGQLSGVRHEMAHRPAACSADWATGTAEVRASMQSSFAFVRDVVGDELPGGFPTRDVVEELDNLTEQVLAGRNDFVEVEFRVYPDGENPESRRVSLGSTVQSSRMTDLLFDAYINDLKTYQQEVIVDAFISAYRVVGFYMMQDGVQVSPRLEAVKPLTDLVVQVGGVTTGVTELLEGENLDPREQLPMHASDMTWDLAKEATNLWAIADGAVSELLYLLGTPTAPCDVPKG